MPEHTTSPNTRKATLFHPLVYLEDGDGVTIGRVDIESYAIFPPDGAQLVRWLADGATTDEAADRYREEHGESADVEDVMAAGEDEDAHAHYDSCLRAGV